MTTSPKKDIRTLSFRISTALWIRIGDATRRLGQTTQTFCTVAIDRYLQEHGYGIDEVNGPPVRTALPRIRKS